MFVYHEESQGINLIAGKAKSFAGRSLTARGRVGAVNCGSKPMWGDDYRGNYSDLTRIGTGIMIFRLNVS